MITNGIRANLPTGFPDYQPCYAMASLTLSAVSPDSVGGMRVREFVQNRFFQSYGARPNIQVPDLLALTRTPGRLVAAVGVRNAENATLFLETYLDRPIEDFLPVGQSCDRSRIAEIAHLAGVESGVSRFLFPLLTVWLQQRACEWIAFTGTAQLRNSFKRMGIPVYWIAAADPDRLPGRGEGWGSYYAHHPQVMIAHVPTGYAALASSGLTQRIQYPAMQGEHYDLTA